MTSARRNTILLLDDVENVMQEDWRFRPFFGTFLSEVNRADIGVPVFLCSTSTRRSLIIRTP